MFIRSSSDVLVAGQQMVIVKDGLHLESFYDFQTLATPANNFTGSVVFKIGGITVKTVNFANERQIASLVSQKDVDYYALPPTTNSALEDECGPSGDDLLMTVEITNTDVTDVMFRVHFMSQFVAGTS